MSGKPIVATVHSKGWPNKCLGLSMSTGIISNWFREDSSWFGDLERELAVEDMLLGVKLGLAVEDMLLGVKALGVRLDSSRKEWDKTDKIGVAKIATKNEGLNTKMVFF